MRPHRELDVGPFGSRSGLAGRVLGVLVAAAIVLAWLLMAIQGATAQVDAVPILATAPVEDHSDVPDLPDLYDTVDLIQPTWVHLVSGSPGLDSGVLFRVELRDGVPSFGEAVDAPSPLSRGLYWTADGALLDNDGDVIDMEPGSLISVAHDFESGTVDDGGWVTCGDGYYACCFKTKHGAKRAKCRPNEDADSDCIQGGKGTVSCGWNAAIEPLGEPLPRD